MIGDEFECNTLEYILLITSNCSNSSPILELSDKFVFQICHDNINKPLDGIYLANFGIHLSCNKCFHGCLEFSRVANPSINGFLMHSHKSLSSLHVMKAHYSFPNECSVLFSPVQSCLVLFSPVQS